MIYQEAKSRDFERFFAITNYVIQYTGSVYIVINKGQIVTQGKTDEEIYSFIVGFLLAYDIQMEEIENREYALEQCTKNSKDNIFRYEEILKSLDQESIL